MIATGHGARSQGLGFGPSDFAGPTGTLWLDKPSTFTGKVADFGAQESVDLPGIGLGVHTRLGYSENSSDTGGILSVKEGTHAHLKRILQLHEGQAT